MSTVHLGRPEPVRRFAVVCFGLSRARVNRQPWHTASGLAEGLTALGHGVLLVTDAEDPPRDSAYVTIAVPRLFVGGAASEGLAAAIGAFGPERVFVVVGCARLARLAPLDFGAPVSLVMASPRLHRTELARLGLRSLWRERRELGFLLLDALLPDAALRRGFRRSGADDIVYLSDAARRRYGQAGLPSGRRLLPQVAAAAAAWAAAPVGVPTLAYIGPALDARGAGLVLSSFEQAVRRGLRARLLLLLRDDSPPGATERLVRLCERSPYRKLITCETDELDALELRQRLADVHAFVLPFRVPVSEVPLVVIEAGLSGRPVVVLDTPGVGEYARAFGGIVAGRKTDLPAALVEACGRSRRDVADAGSWTRWDRAVAPLMEPRELSLEQLAMVSLVGVDGSGKTSLAGLLAGRIALAGVPCRRVWSRFRNYLSKPLLALTRLTGHNRKEMTGGTRVGYHEFACFRPLAVSFLALQLIDCSLDILFRFRLLRRGTLVADRCALDTLVDLAIDTGLDDFVIDRLAPRLVRLLPQPWAAVVIERRAALIAAERPDALADRNFTRRRALYRRLAARLNLPVIANDVAPHAAVEAILGRLAPAGSCPGGVT